MRITKLRLQNFKRFTDLTIEGIPLTAKLVLLIGANGSGKSCVFDAFEILTQPKYGLEVPDSYDDQLFYRKDKNQPITVELDSAEGREYKIERGNKYVFAIPASTVQSHFYGRTSFRQIPRLVRRNLGGRAAEEIAKNTDNPLFSIERDNRFENDIEQITETIVEEIFLKKSSGDEIRRVFVDPINSAFARIFGSGNGTKLELTELIAPLAGKAAQINFKKGNSKIHYDVLSAGEKEVFNILVDLLIRQKLYQDTVYFLDEIDLHLNTSIQSTLLQEIAENWIPANCQLWTASHSLGFIDYARHAINAAIINFDDLDFDVPQTLFPEPKENLDLYEIAVPKPVLFEMLKGKTIVVCENKNDSYLNMLAIPDTVFVGVRDARDVFLHIKRDPRYHSLRDRDFISDAEIERIRKLYPNHYFLKYYCFENYLYHPDNIAELNPPGFDKASYTAEIARQRNEKRINIITTIASSRQTYEEFKTDFKLDEKSSEQARTEIASDFESNEFERFYKFFDMKDQFNKSYLAPFQLSVERLVKTQWFKQKISEAMSG